MRRRSILLACLLCACSFLDAQSYYHVFFRDKTPAALPHHTDAIASRVRHHLPPDAADVPVSAEYLQCLQNAGIHVLAQSRWLNLVACRLTPAQLYYVGLLPFVADIRPINSPGLRVAGEVAYGQAAYFNKFMNLPELHRAGYNGAGAPVAVLDNGFAGVDTITAFKPLFAENRLRDTYNYTQDIVNVYRVGNGHGTQVLSVLAGNAPGQYVGVAPGARYLLYATDVGPTERHIEETWWVQAAERAETHGARILSSSLVYNTFDPNEGDYTYQDMNGNTAISTRGADAAAGRGLLVVNSAGNEGSGPWKYILAPADGDSVLTVGAVTRDSLYAGFSSIGPTADGRLKPDVVTFGQNVAYIKSSGLISQGSGTSFAAPAVAGLAACLLQAVPDAAGWEIRQAIIASAHLYATPDNKRGHGVPDAAIALRLLREMVDKHGKPTRLNITLGANPVQDVLEFFVATPDVGKPLHFSLIDMQGRDVWRADFTPSDYADFGALPLEALTGVYYLRIRSSSGETLSRKIIVRSPR